MSINVEIEQLPESLQPMAKKFQAEVLEYQDTQRQFLEAVAETNRLKTAAEALEGEAEQANQQWKAMAMEPRADQRKINGVIERSVKLKEDAAALRRTVDVREQLHDQLTLKMAQARYALLGTDHTINTAFSEWRLQQCLADESWIPQVADIFSASRAVFLGERNTFNGFEHAASPLTIRPGQDYSDQVLLNFAKVLLSKLGSGAGATKIVAQLPPPVSGEVVASSMVALRKLVENGGKIPNDIAANGGNFGPIKGLKKIA